VLKLLRRVGPDILLLAGIGCALIGAYFLSPYAALALFGLGLVALAVWMGV
jgi:hypothetical protein